MVLKREMKVKDTSRYMHVQIKVNHDAKVNSLCTFGCSITPVYTIGLTISS